MKFQVLLPILYLVLFFAALIVFFVYPSNDGLSVVYAFILTLPWCLVAAALRLVSDLSSVGAVLCVCAALNFCILYVLGGMIDRARKHD